MLDPVKSASASVNAAVKRGAALTITLHWQEDSKSWLFVGTLHRAHRNVTRTLKVNHTGAPDVDDLVRLLGAMGLECESWLW